MLSLATVFALSSYLYLCFKHHTSIVTYCSDTSIMKDKPSSSYIGPSKDRPSLPFEEWIDHEISQESWTEAAVKPSKPERSTGKPRRSPSSMKQKDVIVPDFHFEDTQVVHLPYSILAYDWKKPSEIFPDATFEVYKHTNQYPDLISNNKHLLASRFMRNFISSVHILMYLGNTAPFDIEYVSPHFTPTTQGVPWKPWHHIYSNSLAGTQREHNPTFNPAGKYIVRLFWMGTWRKVYVNDKLPVDLLNHVLLPSLVPPKPKEDLTKKKYPLNNSRSQLSKTKLENQEDIVIEIWPFLLSKALLKIASLTWYGNEEIIDFDIIECLTGWTPQNINVKGFTSSQIWELCWANSNHYSWEQKMPPTNEKEDKEKQDLSRKSSKKSTKSKKSDGSIKVEEDENIEDEIQQLNIDEDFNPCHLVARCNDLRNIRDDKGADSIFPCWSHDFLIHQTRDIPLVKPTITADLDFWKRFRWLSWAVSKGLVPEEELLAKIMNYRLVSSFKQMPDLVQYRQPSRISISDNFISNTDIGEPSNLDEKTSKGKGGGLSEEKKGMESKASKISNASKSSNTSKASRDNKIEGDKMGKNKKDKGDKKSVDSKDDKAENMEPPPDPSFWVDYEKISSQINTLIVYYKPSEFNTKLEITDLDSKQTKEKKESDWKVFLNPLTLQKCRNEPIYIFTESLHAKTIVINLSQTGYTPILQPEKKTEVKTATVATDEITECEFCLASLIKRVRGNLTEEEVKSYIPILFKPVRQLVKHYRFASHIVIEEYNWKSDKFGDPLVSFNTYGSKTVSLCFPPGRTALKLWIRSEGPYVAHIFSNASVIIGDIEMILTSMSKESQLLEDMCNRIANSFQKLTQSYGTPEFRENLKDFYKSYKPEGVLTKSEAALLHGAFFEVLSDMVYESLSKRELFALKILLFRWQRRPRLNYEDCYNLCNCYDEQGDLQYLKALQRYIIKIQAYSRGKYERSLMKYHDSSHGDYKTMVESLENINLSIFSPEVRFRTFPIIIRGLLEHPDLVDVKTKFNVYKDLEKVLHIKEISSSVKLKDSVWSLICRHQLTVNSSDPVPLRIRLFCNLEQYVVRVIDNDTSEEIKRYTNNVAANDYKANIKGYTVLCYAWSTHAHTLPYKLCFFTHKDTEEDKFTASPNEVEAYSLYGMYIPNIHNTICNYLVKVHSQFALLSAHFVCSYDEAVIKLKLFDDQGTLLKELVGTGNIILPAVVLENSISEHSEVEMNPLFDAKRKLKKSASKRKKSSYALDEAKMADKSLDRLSSVGFKEQDKRKKSGSDSVRSHKSDNRDTRKSLKSNEPTVYRIEVTLVDDSWPLTAEEWRNIGHGVCEDTLRSQMKRPGSSSSSKPSLSSLRKLKHKDSSSQISTHRRDSCQFMHKPYWTLEAIQNYGEFVEVVKDTKREKEMCEIKRKWGETDKFRARKAQELRKKFLEDKGIPNPNYYNDDLRSLDKDIFSARILPPLDLTPYMIKNPEEVQHKRKIKHEAELKEDYLKEVALIEQAENRYKRDVEKMDKFIEEQIENMNITNSWFNEIREESSQLMAEAKELKQNYIKELLAQKRAEKAAEAEENEENGTSQGEKKEKKEKKSKKGKKDKKG